MPSFAIETHGLTRHFGRIVAANDLTFDVPLGGVVGVVGPNGSGKSTTLRMLLGLIRPSSGTAEVLGSSITNPGRYAWRVGALIESPAFVPALSAQRNLASLATLRGLPSRRIDEVLQIVGLAGRATDEVRTFSLGMKQRLGIAAALLPDPELLILDEPTNGLDPAGIVEIRSLLKRLGSSGRTVLVSSHLLSELEAIADYVVVIRFGELLFAGPLHGLMQRAKSHFEVEPESPADGARLVRLYREHGWNAELRDGLIRVEVDLQQGAKLNRVAQDAAILLSQLAPHTQSLEEVFLQLTDVPVVSDTMSREVA